MIRMVGGWMFLLVPAHPGSPVQRTVKRLLSVSVFCPLFCFTCAFANELLLTSGTDIWLIESWIKMLCIPKAVCHLLNWGWLNIVSKYSLRFITKQSSYSRSYFNHKLRRPKLALFFVFTLCRSMFLLLVNVCFVVVGLVCPVRAPGP